MVVIPAPVPLPISFADAVPAAPATSSHAVKATTALRRASDFLLCAVAIFMTDMFGLQSVRRPRPGDGGCFITKCRPTQKHAQLALGRKTHRQQLAYWSSPNPGDGGFSRVVNGLRADSQVTLLLCPSRGGVAWLEDQWQLPVLRSLLPRH